MPQAKSPMQELVDLAGTVDSVALRWVAIFSSLTVNCRSSAQHCRAPQLPGEAVGAVQEGLGGKEALAVILEAVHPAMDELAEMVAAEAPQAKAVMPWVVVSTFRAVCRFTLLTAHGTEREQQVAPVVSAACLVLEGLAAKEQMVRHQRPTAAMAPMAEVRVLPQMARTAAMHSGALCGLWLLLK
jgi:hypothetical protein